MPTDSIVMAETSFILNDITHLPDSGKISWRSPSNIALIKYWGKYGNQLPKNASISFTLKNSHTETTLDYQLKDSDDFDFEVYLDGKREPSFEPKILRFFERIEKYLPFLKSYRFKIHTANSFPHSSGIASSASGLSALALCLMDIEKLVTPKMDKDYFLKKASFLARLGSGSACRSLEGPLIVWGDHGEVEGSSNLFGIKYPYQVHPVFTDYKDCILLVDKGEKQVSSTVGHNLMHNHPFAEQRFQQAQDNLKKLIPILEEGDVPSFIEIVESEALSLHAMMLTSTPYFILMKPNTLEIINRIWEFRKTTGSLVSFTLDAGANVHLLYPSAEADGVERFVKERLASFCKNGDYILDEVGEGAIEL